MTLAVTEVVCRMIWGKVAQFMKTSAMIITWSVVFLVAYTGMALSRTFYQFLICFILVGIAFAGVGCHKHSFTVELVGLRLQPDYIIIDNSCAVPVLMLVGTYGPKIGALVGVDSPSAILWVCALFCFVNLLIAIYLHKVAEVRRKSRKISEKGDDRKRYISECLTDINSSLARLTQ